MSHRVFFVKVQYDIFKIPRPKNISRSLPPKSLIFGVWTRDPQVVTRRLQSLSALLEKSRSYNHYIKSHHYRSRAGSNNYSDQLLIHFLQKFLSATYKHLIWSSGLYFWRIFEIWKVTRSFFYRSACTNSVVKRNWQEVAWTENSNFNFKWSEEIFEKNIVTYFDQSWPNFSRFVKKKYQKLTFGHPI